MQETGLVIVLAFFNKKNYYVKLMYKYILFDFDGVLVDSNSIRHKGFATLFRLFPEKEVEELFHFSQKNGGMSRFEKIRYFFTQIRNENITEEKIFEYAKQYSVIVKEQVILSNAIPGSVDFLESFKDSYTFALISASDQEELRDICHVRNIDSYFEEILGSPTLKAENISMLFAKKGWKKEESVYIGDSPNDLKAAMANNLDFIGLNSVEVHWNKESIITIDSFSQLPQKLLKK